MTMRHTLILATTALCLLSGCSSEKIEVLKSPCVGLDASPCGPKRVPNGNWVSQGVTEQA